MLPRQHHWRHRCYPKEEQSGLPSTLGCCLALGGTPGHKGWILPLGTVPLLLSARVPRRVTHCPAPRTSWSLGEDRVPGEQKTEGHPCGDVGTKPRASLTHPHPAQHSGTCWGRAAAPRCLCSSCPTAPKTHQPRWTLPGSWGGGDICPRSCTEPPLAQKASPSQHLCCSGQGWPWFCTNILRFWGSVTQRRALGLGSQVLI